MITPYSLWANRDRWVQRGTHQPQQDPALTQELFEDNERYVTG